MSLRDQVNDQLTEYAEIVKKYFIGLSSVAENTTVDPTNNPEILLARMAAVDENLQKAVDHIEEHQKRQQRIIQVHEDIQQQNITLLKIIQKLDTVQQDLDQDLIKAKTELKAIQYATESNVQFTDVLTYASKLSKYTSAPPNFDAMNKDIKIDFEKPYPDEERMRRGALYWQNAPQESMEERFESSDSEDSAKEDATDGNANKQTDDANGEAFWVLDLNPDMAA
ncbi:hypothetical protein K501DRAFT_338334 [Backusella circina FSU 941]|nr:hypothetical protein K501DRAFT_338334 [Backusella circina FSU 941]